MSIKSERITLLGTPDFKAFLASEAKSEGVSVSELVRRRCEAIPPSDDEVALKELLQIATKATASLEKGLNDASSVLVELRSRH